jgi:hypothetical protein
MHNYFPNYTCGECSAWLAYEDNLLNDIVKESCQFCNLYKLGLKQVSKDLLSYKNIFIKVYDHNHFEVVNRPIRFYDVQQCCQYIEEMIHE